MADGSCREISRAAMMAESPAAVAPRKAVT